MFEIVIKIQEVGNKTTVICKGFGPASRTEEEVAKGIMQKLQEIPDGNPNCKINDRQWKTFPANKG